MVEVDRVDLIKVDQMVVLVVVVDKKIIQEITHLVEQVTVQIQQIHHKVLPEELVRGQIIMTITLVAVVVQLLLVRMQLPVQQVLVVQDHQLALLVVI
tara:strand:+ start:427 stop:720 length:294 start_codon:yes stop_codon:yes gene_type:complete